MATVYYLVKVQHDNEWYLQTRHMLFFRSSQTAYKVSDMLNYYYSKMFYNDKPITNLKEQLWHINGDKAYSNCGHVAIASLLIKHAEINDKHFENIELNNILISLKENPGRIRNILRCCCTPYYLPPKSLYSIRSMNELNKSS